MDRAEFDQKLQTDIDRGYLAEVDGQYVVTPLGDRQRKLQVAASIVANITMLAQKFAVILMAPAPDPQTADEMFAIETGQEPVAPTPTPALPPPPPPPAKAARHLGQYL